MQWLCLITFAALALVRVCGAAVHSSSPSAGLQVQHGTLAVVVLESNQIVIAIDSRATANRPGQTNFVVDGFEKVIPLSQHVAFFFTGAGRFDTRDSTNSLSEMAKAVAADWKEHKRELHLEKLAEDFKGRVAHNLSRLTIADIHFLDQIATKKGGSKVFQAVFAGQDSDASFRIFEVTCRSIVETNNGKMDARLSFDVAERKRVGRQWMLFLGDTRVFGDGMNDPTAPLAPLMRQLKTSNALLAEPVAASLLAAAIGEYGDGPESSVGYPIFVYGIDKDGFRMTRKVEKGQRVTFDAAAQGK